MLKPSRGLVASLAAGVVLLRAPYLIGLPLPARAEPPAALAPLEWLLGSWEAIPGADGATGGFAFARSVQDHVIIRTNYSNAPATPGTPASRHDDLLVIYVDGGAVGADYFDSEGHVIRYRVDAKAGTVVFLSDLAPGQPRYRLTYIRQNATLTGRFEVAPPDHPDRFTTYLNWTARRIGRSRGAL